jgi:hypothetical protein
MCFKYIVQIIAVQIKDINKMKKHFTIIIFCQMLGVLVVFIINKEINSCEVYIVHMDF